MALTYIIDDDADLIRIHWTGDPADEANIEVMKQLFADPALRPGLNYLTDQRELVSPGTTSMVEDSVELLKRMANILGPFKCAIVVRREVSYGMGRMAEGLAYGSEIEIKTFFALEDAEKWLAE